MQCYPPDKDWDMSWLGIGDATRAGVRREEIKSRAKLNTAVVADRVRGVYP